MPAKAENRFRRTREDHARETAEDYVEMILSLIEEGGEARAVDLADRMGVSQVTVGKTLQRLRREGLIIAQPYRSIHLTQDGRQMATDARDRHQLVLRFLERIGVPRETAIIDAEGIEHHVSEETLAAMKRYLAAGSESK